VRGSHDEYLQPTNPLTMWAYTDFSDSRWKFTTKYVSLRMDPAQFIAEARLWNAKTWAAYALNGQLFIKRYSPRRQQLSRFRCSFEMFTTTSFSKWRHSAITKVRRREVEHSERWSIHRMSN